MFKNRFTLIAVTLFVLLVSLAIASPFSNASGSADLSWQPGPVIIPVTGVNDLSDYHQRHSELRGVSAESVDTSLNRPQLDECFDVSLSEVAACREASQSPSP